MLILELFNNPIVFLAFLAALVMGISVHEFAHAWVANLLGDPTAKYQGRVTLDPRSHLDPIGTLMLFIAGFGWGKPVPINPQYFARPALDELLVALAGPASNFITAAILGLGIQVLGPNTISSFLVVIVHINLLLMIFNLLPVPPLDGSKILHIFIGEKNYRILEAFSLPFIMVLLFLLYASGLGQWMLNLVQRLTEFLI